MLNLDEGTPYETYVITLANVIAHTVLAYENSGGIYTSLLIVFCTVATSFYVFSHNRAYMKYEDLTSERDLEVVIRVGMYSTIKMKLLVILSWLLTLSVAYAIGIQFNIFNVLFEGSRISVTVTILFILIIYSIYRFIEATILSIFHLGFFLHIFLSVPEVMNDHVISVEKDLSDFSIAHMFIDVMKAGRGVVLCSGLSVSMIVTLFMTQMNNVFLINNQGIVNGILIVSLATSVLTPIFLYLIQDAIINASRQYVHRYHKIDRSRFEKFSTKYGQLVMYTEDEDEEEDFEDDEEFVEDYKIEIDEKTEKSDEVDRDKGDSK